MSDNFERETAQVKILTLVATMVGALIDYPDESRCRVELGEGLIVVNISVATADVGKLIGKQGLNARALRTIVMAAGRKLDLRCEVNISQV